MLYWGLMGLGSAGLYALFAWMDRRWEARVKIGIEMNEKMNG